MNLDVRIEELLPHPVGPRPRTEPLEFRMKTGHLSADGWVEAEVLELDPPRRMVWAWSIAGGAEPTRVTFELAPDGGGTRLTLTHAGEIDSDIGALLAEGWPSRIEVLRRSLD